MGAEQVTIYALYEPGDPDAIRYIGMTRKPLEVRLKFHFIRPSYAWDRRTARWTWIAGLLERGLTPGIRGLETVSEAQGYEREKWYIRAYEARGVPLVNGHYTQRYRETMQTVARTHWACWKARRHSQSRRGSRAGA